MPNALRTPCILSSVSRAAYSLRPTPAPATVLVYVDGELHVPLIPRPRFVAAGVGIAHRGAVRLHDQVGIKRDALDNAMTEFFQRRHFVLEGHRLADVGRIDLEQRFGVLQRGKTQGQIPVAPKNALECVHVCSSWPVPHGQTLSPLLRSSRLLEMPPSRSRLHARVVSSKAPWRSPCMHSSETVKGMHPEIRRKRPGTMPAYANKRAYAPKAHREKFANSLPTAHRMLAGARTSFRRTAWSPCSPRRQTTKRLPPCPCAF